MRILVADNQSSARLALFALLEQQPGWQVVEEVVSADELMSEIKVSRPDLILLDLSLPELIAEELLPVLREKYMNISVIVLSCRPETRSKALAAGADAFISKADPPDRLLQAISSAKQS
jgi:DNA-binding NarL/FixJ family response regulator